MHMRRPRRQPISDGRAAGPAGKDRERRPPRREVRRTTAPGMLCAGRAPRPTAPGAPRGSHGLSPPRRGPLRGPAQGSPRRGTAEPSRHPCGPGTHCRDTARSGELAAPAGHPPRCPQPRIPPPPPHRPSLFVSQRSRPQPELRWVGEQHRAPQRRGGAGSGRRTPRREPAASGGGPSGELGPPAAAALPRRARLTFATAASVSFSRAPSAEPPRLHSTKIQRTDTREPRAGGDPANTALCC